MAMNLRLPRCPVCGTVMRRDQFKASPPWTCSGCSNQFQFSRSSSGIKAYIGIALSFTFCYIVGLRGWLLLVSGFVMWIPATLLVVATLSAILRPRLQPYSAPGEESHFTSLFPNETTDSSVPKPPHES
jgi:hypothetical protein